MEVTLYTFGDGQRDCTEDLENILRSSNISLHTDFFAKAYGALRAEVDKLPLQQKKQYPKFSSIQDLLLRRHTSLLPCTLRAALCCVHQLSLYLSFAINRQLTNNRNAAVCVQGFGIGAVSAAAAGSSRTLPELLELSIHAVRVVFNATLRAHEVAESIERSIASQDSTCTIKVHDWTASESNTILEAFNQQNGRPETSNVYISLESRHVTAFSGPESSLKDFRSSLPAGLKIQEPFMGALFHNSSLFTEQDVEAVKRACLSYNWPKSGQGVSVLSAADGRMCSAPSFEGQIESALQDLFLSTISWDKMLNGLSYMTNIHHNASLRIYDFGADFGDRLRKDVESLPLFSSVQEVHLERIHSSAQQFTTSPFSERLDSKPAFSSPSGKSRIAVVGLSGRFPEAEDLDEFWNVLSQGLDVHRTTPSTRWNVDTHVDPTGKRKNTSRVPHGCWLKNPGHFDIDFFGMSPREAAQVDPASRLALMTAYEAMEEAGMVPNRTPSTSKDRVGVLYGVTSNDWMEVNSAQNIDTYFIPGGCRAFIPGRINYFFKFSGLSSSTDTACSSSLSAVHAACNALWQHDIDTAIVGGTNVLTNPDYTAGLDRGHFLSRTGNCKSFDQDADGYCRGEAVCTLILKRLEDAVADNDPIKGMILGTYTNHSAEAESITRPQMSAQEDIFTKVLSDTGVQPFDVSYVEMHGTGTQAGDLCEMTSVTQVLAPNISGYSRDARQPLHVGSVKSNIGHGEAAAGASSLAKVLLMMRHNTIPPHCGIKGQINQRFPSDLGERQVHIARERKPWASPAGRTRKAFINNFSAAGGNSALLVEEAPHKVTKTPETTRSSHIIAISAKSLSALTGNVQALSLYLQTHAASTDLANLSYTTTARRMHHPYRAAICSSTVDDAVSKLQSLNIDAQYKKLRKPRTVFAFAGSGSHFLGIGKHFYSHFQVFRESLTQLNLIAKTYGFPSILDHYLSNSDVIFDPDIITEHLGIICLEIAYTKLLSSWGILPSIAVGHSLGEYAALNAAGVLSDADTIFIVGKRAQLLKGLGERKRGGMLAVMASEELLRSQVPDVGLEIACYNSPDDIVLSGSPEQVSVVFERLKRQGLKAKKLPVSYAFHSSHMDTIMEDLIRVARGIKFNKPTIPVISPLLSSVVSDQGTFSPEYLSRHLRLPVNFSKSILNAKTTGHLMDKEIFIEIGPQTCIAGCIKRTVGSSIPMLIPPRLDQDIWQWTSKTMRDLYTLGYDVDWTEYHRPFEDSLDVLELPHYSWNIRNFWIQYVHDWSLRKGDPLPTTPYAQAVMEEVKLAKAPEPVLPSMKLEDSVIQTVLVEKMSEDILTLNLQLDLLHPNLKSASQGHKVANVPLVTPSFYADIAMRVGNYYMKRYKPNMSGRFISVDQMIIESALVAPDSDEPRFLYIDASVQAKGSLLKFYTTKHSGERKTQHAQCQITFRAKSEGTGISQDRCYQASQDISRLREECATGQSFRFNNAMIYKMVGSLAQFDAPYRQVSEIVLNSDNLDAFSTVKLQLGKDSPSLSSAIDALSQAAGFVMNGNDKANLEQEVFVNHGWSSFSLPGTLSSDKTYTSYVKLCEQEHQKWEGDIIVMDSEQVVACFKGITLQKVPRRLLDRLLSVAARGLDTKPAPSHINSTERAEPRRPASGFIPRGSVSVSPSSSPPPRYSYQDPVSDSSSNLVEEKIRPRNTELVVQNGGHQGVIKADDHIRGRQPSLAQSDPPQKDIFKDVLKILAEETGTGLNEFTEDAALADLGIDSLLSLTLAARFEDELEFDFLSKHSLYTDFQTIGDLKKHVQGATGSIDVKQEEKIIIEPIITDPVSIQPIIVQRVEVDQSPVSLEMDLLYTDPPGRIVEKTRPCPPATSTVLQGRFNSEVDTLFVFPDGGGSAASYGQIARVSPTLCVVGLNSPFYKEPKEMSFTSLDSIMNAYIKEIRRRRPYGPYRLAGWSSGGILAYRAAQQLIREGDDVLSLALIDAPPPTGLDRLPPRWYKHCEATGVFAFAGAGQGGSGSGDSSGSSTPSSSARRTLEHFDATIDVLEDYIADPLPPGFCPKVSIAWAAECVFDGVRYPKFPARDDDPPGIKFLTEKRTDMTAGPWRDLFPGEKVHVHVFHDADHFSMLRTGCAEQMARFLRRALT